MTSLGVIRTSRRKSSTARKLSIRPVEAPPGGVLDDSDTEEPEVEPPVSTDHFPKISGYQDVKFGIDTVIPAQQEKVCEEDDRPKIDYKDLILMEENEIRQTLLSWISQHFCYGSKAGQEMKFTKIEPTMALHYTLETFTETRSFTYRHVPYEYTPVDHPATQPESPLPWDIEITPTKLFEKHIIRTEVPRTNTIQDCHTCRGRGWNRCRACHGTRKIKCKECNGKGTKRVQARNQLVSIDCKTCVDGKRLCTRCTGKTRVSCFTCKGQQKLKFYIELTSTFANNCDEYILEETDMPDKLIRSVDSDTILEQTLPLVRAIVDSPFPPLNENCQKLIEMHSDKYQNEKRLQQHQVLKAVPVTEVHYEWKNKSSRFWVYGKTNKLIYCTDYPQRICCGCQIL